MVLLLVSTRQLTWLASAASRFADAVYGCRWRLRRLFGCL